jgi:small subunit ribosomal protein S20
LQGLWYNLSSLAQKAFIPTRESEWTVQFYRRNTLANLKSSIKRIRSSRRKAEYNQIRRSTARTYIKKARSLIAEGNLEEAQAVVQLAISALDRAAQRGVIHKNNAARRKSRLVQQLNQAMQS